MDNNKSEKRYRGIKYIVLLLLVVAAFGITFYGKNQQTNDENQASSIKNAASDALVKGDDKIASFVSGTSEKTTRPIESAEDASKELLDDINTGSSDEADQTSGWPAAEKRLPLKAEEVLSDGTQQAQYTTEDGKAYSDMKSSAPSTVEEMAAHQKAGNDEKAQKENTAGTSLPCIGPPPNGKDLGNRYIVASCESLSIISERTGVEFNKLREHNPQVKNPDLIYPNQILQLPPRG